MTPDALRMVFDMSESAPNPIIRSMSRLIVLLNRDGDTGERIKGCQMALDELEQMPDDVWDRWTDDVSSADRVAMLREWRERVEGSLWPLVDVSLEDQSYEH